MSKRKIQEVLVVEGAHDAAHLKRFYDCDVIITSGIGLQKETIQQIKTMQEKRGVIIFTDPDAPGEKIRKWINEAVPGCKNAFVLKQDARTSKKVGVEHASFPVLQEALSHVVTYQEEISESISYEEMIDLGLVGGSQASVKREIVSKAFHLGKANAKTLFHRLNCLGVTKDKIEEVLRDGEKTNCE